MPDLYVKLSMGMVMDPLLHLRDIRKLAFSRKWLFYAFGKRFILNEKDEEMEVSFGLCKKRAFLLD